MLYTQCEVHRNNQLDVCWVPAEAAVIGRVLRLKREGEWEDGWRITETYATLPAATVERQRDEYRHHRDRTDI